MSEAIQIRLDSPFWILSPNQKVMWLEIERLKAQAPLEIPTLSGSVKVEPGQLFTSYKKLSQQTGQTLRQTRGALDVIVRADLVSRKRVGNGVLITTRIYEGNQVQAEHTERDKRQTIWHTLGRPKVGLDGTLASHLPRENKEIKSCSSKNTPLLNTSKLNTNNQNHTVALATQRTPTTTTTASEAKSKKIALTREAVASVALAFNEGLNRNLGAKGFENPVKRLLAKGYTQKEMRAVIWWADQEWGDEPERIKRLSSTTLFKLQSSQGYRTFPEYLAAASERWREVEREDPPWEKR